MAALIKFALFALMCRASNLLIVVLFLSMFSMTVGIARAEQQDSNLQRSTSSIDPITAFMDNVSGDTYYAKFSNSSSDDYRVYYKIKDGDKIVQDETSMIVKANSSNSNGPYHCSPTATIEIIRTEKI